MNINNSYVDKNGVKYEGVIEKAFKKDELKNIGILLHQTEREKNVFGKENGVYIYQDRDNKNIGYRIYDEFADYGFNGYLDHKLISELNRNKDNIKLTEFPYGIVTCEENIIGQIIPYYPNSETVFNYAKRTKDVNIIKYYKKMIIIINELLKNGITYSDAHAKNFLVVKDKIRLIDFEYFSMSFKDSACFYESMICNLISTINNLNNIVGIDYSINFNIKNIDDLKDSVNEMEKKLVK